MAVSWQIECFVPIYNAVHDTRTEDILGRFLLNYHLHVCDLVQLYIWLNLYNKIIHRNVGILLANHYGWIQYT